jgi:hypothetical protein
MRKANRGRDRDADDEAKEAAIFSGRRLAGEMVGRAGFEPAKA